MATATATENAGSYLDERSGLEARIARGGRGENNDVRLSVNHRSERDHTRAILNVVAHGNSKVAQIVDAGNRHLRKNRGDITRLVELGK